MTDSQGIAENASEWLYRGTLDLGEWMQWQFEVLESDKHRIEELSKKLADLKVANHGIRRWRTA